MTKYQIIMYLSYRCNFKNYSFMNNADKQKLILYNNKYLKLHCQMYIINDNSKALQK